MTRDLTLNRENGSQCGREALVAAQGLRFTPNRLRTGLVELWRRVLRSSRRTPKSLRLRASLPLGERRFVAVVEFEQARFLVGGTSSSLVLLSRLQDCDAGVEDEAESCGRGLGEVKPERPRGDENRGNENRGNKNLGNENRGSEKC